MCGDRISIVGLAFSIFSDELRIVRGAIGVGWDENDDRPPVPNSGGAWFTKDLRIISFWACITRDRTIAHL